MGSVALQRTGAPLPGKPWQCGREAPAGPRGEPRQCGREDPGEAPAVWTGSHQQDPGGAPAVWTGSPHRTPGKETEGPLCSRLSFDFELYSSVFITASDSSPCVCLALPYEEWVLRSWEEMPTSRPPGPHSAVAVTERRASVSWGGRLLTAFISDSVPTAFFV